MNTNVIKIRKPIVAALACLGLLALFISRASAQSIVWGDTATDFNADSSWVGGNAPGAADIAEFPVDGSIGFQPELTAAIGVSGLDFLQAGYTLSGAYSLTVGTNGVSSAGAGTNTVSAGLVMGANSSWNIASGNTFSVSSTMNFAGQTLTKTGDGTLTLSVSNTASAASKLVVNAGTVRVANVAFLGSANAADAITLNGGTIEWAYNSATPSGYGMVIGSSGGTIVSTVTPARLRGNISGNGTLALNGVGGTIQIEGASNTHTGDTIINTRVRNFSASGLGDLSAVTINSGGGILEFVSAGDTIGSLAGNGVVRGGAVGTWMLTTGGNNGSTDFSGQIVDNTGTVAFKKIGTGTQTLSGSNSYTGGTTVSGGILKLDTAAGSALGSTASVTVESTATLLISRSNQVNDSAAVTLSGGTIQRASGVNETFGNLSLTTGSFLDYGTGDTGTLAFGTYTPSSLLTVGNFFEGNKLVFSSDLTSTIKNADLFHFDNGFTYDWNGSTFTITAIPEPSSHVAAAGIISLILWSLRRRSLNVASLESSFHSKKTNPDGDIKTMNTNVIKIRKPIVAALACLGLLALFIPRASAQSIVWGDTATDFNADSSWVGGNAPGAADIAEFPVDGSIGFQPELTAAIGVSGLDFLQAGYTLSGAYSLTVGTNGVSSAGAGTNTVSAGLVMGANSSWNIASDNTFSVSSTMNFAGQTLTKTGDGTLTLSVSNTASAASKLVVNAGTVRVANVAFLGSASVADAITLNGGTIEWAYNGATPSGYGMVIGSSGGTIVSAATPARLRGNISGNGTLTLNGVGGTIQIEGASNTHTGDTIINTRVRIFSASGLGDLSAVTINSGGGILEFASASDTIGSLAGNGVVRGGAAGTWMLTTGGNNGSTAFSGQIVDNTGTVAFKKIGTGTQTLSGSNSYTGGTIVSDGTLLVENSKALGTGSVSIEGGMLDLFGSSAGNLDLGAGSNFSLGSGAIAFTLDTVYDTISGTGSFSLTGGVLDLQNFVADYSAGYQIFNGFTGNTLGSFGIINYDTANYAAVLDNSGLLTFDVIPEPSILALLSLPLAGVAFLRFRRKSSGVAGKLPEAA